MSAPLLPPATPEARLAGDPSDQRDSRDQSDRANGANGAASLSTIHLPPSTPAPLTDAALVEACRAMLKLTGGSQYWTGETHAALELMETALKGVRP